METRVSGIVSPDDAVLAIAEARGQVEDDSWYELVQHDEHALIDVDYASGDRVVTHVREFLDTLREGAIAIVAEHDVSYGRCRQIQLRLETRIEVEVFRKGDEARAWLNDKRAQQQASARRPQVDLTVDVAPFFDCAPEHDELVETWRVIRGEFEPDHDVKRRTELPVRIDKRSSPSRST